MMQGPDRGLVLCYNPPMATIADMLRQLGNSAAPQGGNALVGPITLPAYIPSPLPIAAPSELTRGWSGATGRPTEAHHALALAAARAGEGVALMGHGSVPHDDLLLLTLAQLLAAPRATALWLAPDRQTLRATTERLQRVQPALRWQLLGEQAQRGTTAQLLLLTYDDLHRRVLQWADRAWRWLWPSLQCVALPALHHAVGPTGGHVQWLLRRVERLAGPVQLLVALAPVAAADSTLPRLLGRPMRLIAASTGPTTSTLVALWHTGGDRHATLRHLIGALSRHHLALTVLGRDAIETAALHAGLAGEVAVGRGPDAARVALVAGVPATDDARQHLLRAGYRLLLLLAGDTPHERLLLAQPELWGQALPAWPLPRSNSLINAAELVCVAGERPVSQAEIEAWQVADQVRKLVEQGQLQPLAPDETWQPTAAATDPYERLDPHTVRGQSIAVTSASGATYGFVTPDIAERWGLVGAVWSPGLAVESSGNAEVLLAPTGEDHATWPHEDVRLSVRDELAKRSVQWQQRRLELRRITVNVRARVQGLIELQLGQRLREQTVARTAERQWIAMALALPADIPDQHGAAGWALLTTLPLIANASPGALLPWYDRAHALLLLIEVDPGGVGLVEVLYAQMERWLELAHQLAQACATHSLYAPFAGPELQWLQALPVKPATPSPAMAHVPSVAEPVVAPAVIAQPELEQPRGLLVPPPRTPAAAIVQRRSSPVVRTYTMPAVEKPLPVTMPCTVLATEAGQPALVLRAAPAEPTPQATSESAEVLMSTPVVQTELPVETSSPVADIVWEPGLAAPVDEIDDIAWEAEVPPPLPFPARPGADAPQPLRRPAPPRYPPARSPRQVERPVSSPRPSTFGATRPAQPRPALPVAPAPTHEPRPVAEEHTGDVGGMIARLRHLRSTRDAGGEAGLSAPPGPSVPDEAVDPRFRRGDHVHCVPYGEGRVMESVMRGGREQLRIDFGEAGIIEVDAIMGLVRRSEQPAAAAGEDEPSD